MNNLTILMFITIAAIIVVVGTLVVVVVPAQAQQFQNTQTNNQQACMSDCYNDQNAQVSTCADRGGTCQGNNAGNNFGSQEFRDFNFNN